MHARQELTCDFDPFMAPRGGTNFDSGRVAGGPPHRRARANIHRGDGAGAFGSWGSITSNTPPGENTPAWHIGFGHKLFSPVGATRAGLRSAGQWEDALRIS